MTVKRCATCRRAYDSALTEMGDELHSPRCGLRLRGRTSGIE